MISLNSQVRYNVNRRISEYMRSNLDKLRIQLEIEQQKLAQLDREEKELDAKFQKLDLIQNICDQQSKHILEEYSTNKFRYSQIVKQGGPKYQFKYHADQEVQ